LAADFLRTSAESWAPRPFGRVSPEGVLESFSNFFEASPALSLISPLPSKSLAIAYLFSTASGDFGFSSLAGAESALASGASSDLASGAASVLLSSGSSCVPTI